MRLLAVLLLIIAGSWAWAHDPSLSGIKLLLRPDGATISAIAHRSALGGKSLADRLRLVVNGRTWSTKAVRVMDDPRQDTAMIQADFEGPVQGIEILAPLFPERPGAKTLVTVFREGQVAAEGYVSAEIPTWTFGRNDHPGGLAVFGLYSRMGAEHILTGIDHLLFLVGLLLLRPKLKAVLKIVTAFTLAHAATLSICALGLARPNPRIVEPLIALSIVAVALEALLHHRLKRDCRTVIALCFGLIHGFGFGGALLEAGLPARHATIALASFNVGIELVQATLIALTLPMLALATKIQPTATRLAPYALATAGALWFIQRLIQ